jgi:starch synthase/alpha-amylase
MAAKHHAGCAVGILNAPDPDYCPSTDPALAVHYGPDDHSAGKRCNKEVLQERLGLRVEGSAPLFFWPSRLDPVQKGCQLLTDILYETISTYWLDGLQVAVVANGPYQKHFHDIVERHGLYDRVAVCDFDEDLSRLAYAAADFMVMPSRFEPCGLPQMISPIYGTLPVVHSTGGLRDTVSHLDQAAGKGNGFVFEHYDSQGLRWALGQAMAFHRLPAETKAGQIARIMREARERFSHGVTARAYIDIYERMLQRPLFSQLE